MKRRVVVTGLGAVTPIGNTVEEFWTGIRNGKVGIGEITKFDTTDYKVKLAAEVKDFSVKERIDAKSDEWRHFRNMRVPRQKRHTKIPGLQLRRKILFGRELLSVPASEVWKK